ncbi:right-handed parallel beta-helix repeat-containing protein [Aestuariivirga sp.]|uniref:right-handed parallel beta-helix repeat-containing protein n=1 Tax=Aestuariivirga sp. TaxID=2650926 RepID=UPI0039E59357
MIQLPGCIRVVAETAAFCTKGFWNAVAVLVLAAALPAVVQADDVKIFYPTGSLSDEGYTAYVDDTADMQKVLDEQGVLHLEPNKQYRITRSLIISKDGGGIEGDGTSTILMGTGIGEFDNDSNSASTRYASNAVGIRADYIDEPFVRGVVIKPETYVDNRYVKAIAFKHCFDVDVENNDISNFSKSLGLVYLGAVSGGVVRKNFIHDVYTNAETYGQITGIEFDNDDPPSKNVFVTQNKIWRLTVGPVFLAKFGYQTDGINTVKPLTSGLHFVLNDIRFVGEGIDHFGNTSMISRNRIRNTYNFGIKLIHGAKKNRVQLNQITNAGLGGIVLSGSNSPDVGDTSGNVILSNTITGIDTIHSWEPNTTFGIGITANGSTTQLPRNNTIKDNLIDLGRNGKVGILAQQGAGSGNKLIGNKISNFRWNQYLIDPAVAQIQ